MIFHLAACLSLLAVVVPIRGGQAGIAGLEHTIIIDAGSAGSRIHVFSWAAANAVDSLKEVCVKKVHPGLCRVYTS